MTTTDNNAAATPTSGTTTTALTTAAQFATDALWDPAWKESYGEATIRQQLSNKEVEEESLNHQQQQQQRKKRILYCGWFCPFAQRAWVALEELGLEYQYVEVNPYAVDPAMPGGYTKTRQSIQKKKELLPDFVAVSPYGLVPTIVEADGSFVCDSTVCLEYLQQAYVDDNGHQNGKNGKNENKLHRRLFPKDALAASFVRLFIEHSKRIMSAFFDLLTDPTLEGRQKAYEQLVEDARLLAIVMAPDLASDTGLLLEEAGHSAIKHSSVDVASWLALARRVHKARAASTGGGTTTATAVGPFVLGQEFSAADICLGTIWMRVEWEAAYYRNVHITTKEDQTDPALARLRRWWEAVQERPSFRNTMICKERLVACDLSYARRGAGNDTGVLYLDNPDAARPCTTTTDDGPTPPPLKKVKTSKE